ncbi:MAG TPA: bpX6 domain-containing protein [Kineosporiaceae bacterium]|nr:bpX6 domain-containing protein [Kineosporiaceae bacterium]
MTGPDAGRAATAMEGPAAGGPLVRGRAVADGYVIDSGLIGVDEARERVVTAWQAGARLAMLPDGAWLLVLPSAADVRAERAPGLPAQRGQAGRMRVWRHGRLHEFDVEQLPQVNPAGWVDLAGLPVHLLSAVLPARPDPVLEPLPPPAPIRTELRSAAGVGVDPSAERMARVLAAREQRAQRAGARAAWRGRGAVRRGAANGVTGTGGRRRTSGAGSTVMSWLANGPAGAVFRSRHERYVRALAEDFHHNRFDDALRRAIALGGAGGRLTVRLPLPRRGPLAPTPLRSDGGPGLSAPPTVEQYLRTLYTQAAEDLERLGRIEEAAFVRADLLANAWDAVLLLERHGRLALAAELAEGRQLDPAVAVRLWWRAGRRDRAVDLARLRGGFADAVQRLTQTDPSAARELRAEWVQRLLDAGDLHAAVDTAWPESGLRPLVLPHLPAGIAAGGPSGARLLAHLVTHQPTPAAVDAALAVLTSRDEDLAPARAAFVAALGQLRAADLAADRRLASAALRLLTREPTLLAASSDRVARHTTRQLRERADPVLAADAPPTTIARGPDRPRPVEVVAAAEPGHQDVKDAVALPGGVLVGLGDCGTRLLTPEGRVRARWDLRADQLVVADHGRTALLLGWGETTVDVHHLDLTTRKLRHWAHLSARRAVGTFDGALLTLIDDQGLAVLDTTASRPRTVWRELEPGVTVHDLARGPGWITALVQGPAVSVDLVPQLWSWQLPQMILRHRSPVALTTQDGGGSLRGAAVAAAAGLLALHDHDTGPVLTLQNTAGRAIAQATGESLVAVLGSGPFHAAVHQQEGALTVDVLAPWQPAPRPWPEAVVRVHFRNAAAIGIRDHDGVVTIHDSRGRIVAVDTATGRIAANLTLRE